MVCCRGHGSIVTYYDALFRICFAVLRKTAEHFWDNSHANIRTLDILDIENEKQ
jgi:hypothetical protein